MAARTKSPIVRGTDMAARYRSVLLVARVWCRAMALRVNTVTFDADDPAELAVFWARVFGADEPEAVNPFVSIVDNPAGPNLMFVKVPESKTAKNRMHFDLYAEDADVVDAEA